MFNPFALTQRAYHGKPAGDEYLPPMCKVSDIVELETDDADADIDGGKKIKNDLIEDITEKWN